LFQNSLKNITFQEYIIIKQRYLTLIFFYRWRNL